MAKMLRPYRDSKPESRPGGVDSWQVLCLFGRLGIVRPRRWGLPQGFGLYGIAPHPSSPDYGSFVTGASARFAQRLDRTASNCSDCVLAAARHLLDKRIFACPEIRVEANFRNAL
jgi:hypothetical protein